MGLETVISIGIAAVIALLIGIYQRLGDNQKKIEKLLESIWEEIRKS